MNWYILASALVFGFLAVVWQHKTWLNAWIKFLFILMSLLGFFEALRAFGYIIRMVSR